jgi:hypothetical protein
MGSGGHVEGYLPEGPAMPSVEDDEFLFEAADVLGTGCAQGPTLEFLPTALGQRVLRIASREGWSSAECAEERAAADQQIPAAQLGDPGVRSHAALVRGNRIGT